MSPQPGRPTVDKNMRKVSRSFSIPSWILDELIQKEVSSRLNVSKLVSDYLEEYLKGSEKPVATLLDFMLYPKTEIPNILTDPKKVEDYLLNAEPETIEKIQGMLKVWARIMPRVGGDNYYV